MHLSKLRNYLTFHKQVCIIITASTFFKSPKTNLWKKKKASILLHLAECGSNIKETVRCIVFLFFYSWSLTNGGVGVLILRSQTFACNFRCSPNLTTNSLLLTGSQTDNIKSWLANILYVIRIATYILYIHDMPLNFFIFLGYIVCLQVFSNCWKSPLNFLIHLLKKSLYVVQIHVVPGPTVQCVLTVFSKDLRHIQR